MAYIIEDAHLLKKDKVEQTSILIKGDKFDFIKSSFITMEYMKMKADSYVMTPPHILFNPEIPSDNSFQSMKKFYIDTFIKKGCTTFLTCIDVEMEYLLKSSIKKMKRRLLNSPIDFVIGVKIPIRLLTTSFLRKCKREKIPAIFVEVNDDGSALEHVPWGWLREALFPYNCPLIPVFNAEKPRIRRRAQSKWTNILTEQKIPFIKNELMVNEPLSRSDLCKIGIFPVKSGVHQGAEVSYNFYLKEEELDQINEEIMFRQFQDNLIITVHKGTVIRAGEDVLFRAGYGEHVIINTPAFFTVH